MEWIKSGKLEVRAYPSERVHAKLYIMTFHESDRDKGRVITGSSNFTEADTSALEREIDELVYALYGLTPEEIRIVEGAAK